MAIGAIKKIGAKGIVQLNGPLDFRYIQEFISLYEPLLKDVDVTSIEINMVGVDYIDNTAFWMLLTLRDKAQAVKKRIVLGECGGMTRHIEHMTNFGKLFEII